MSTCPRCQATNGTAHSFERVGVLQDGTTQLFYTAPARATDPEDSPEAVQYYLLHFQETRPNSWIWVVDCKGMKTKDLVRSGFGRNIKKVVETTRFDTLIHVYVVNPSWAMKTLITFLKPFMLKETAQKIHMCSLGLIDTCNQLERIGLQRNEMNMLTKKLTTD